MPDLVGNPEDRFAKNIDRPHSLKTAHFLLKAVLTSTHDLFMFGQNLKTLMQSIVNPYGCFNKIPCWHDTTDNTLFCLFRLRFNTLVNDFPSCQDIFLGWTNSNQFRGSVFPKDTTLRPCMVRLEPTTLRSKVRHSPTELAVLQLSLVMRKPFFCICENKDADQLRGNREADQRLCFRYTDSSIPLLPKSENSSL